MNSWVRSMGIELITFSSGSYNLARNLPGPGPGRQGGEREDEGEREDKGVDIVKRSTNIPQDFFSFFFNKFFLKKPFYKTVLESNSLVIKTPACKGIDRNNDK